MGDAMVKKTDDRRVSATQVERRRFLRIFAASSLAMLSSPLARICRAMPGLSNGMASLPAKGFTFAQLVYEGGNWDPEPGAWPSLARVL